MLTPNSRLCLNQRVYCMIQLENFYRLSLLYVYQWISIYIFSSIFLYWVKATSRENWNNPLPCVWPLYDPQRFSKNWKLNKQACLCIIFQNLKKFLFISLLLSSIEQWFIFMDFYNGAWTLKVTGDLLGLWFEKKKIENYHKKAPIYDITRDLFLKDIFLPLSANPSIPLQYLS